MLRPILLLAPIFGLPVLATGCARDADTYPSLAPRAVEKLSFAEPERRPVEVAPDPTLDANVADNRTSLARIAAGFGEAMAKAENATRAAGARTVGSDSWLSAQTLLGGLDTWRSQLSALITTIDQETADRAGTGAPIDPALASVRDDAGAEATKQDAAIARLDAAVPAT